MTSRLRVAFFTPSSSLSSSPSVYASVGSSTSSSFLTTPIASSSMIYPMPSMSSASSYLGGTTSSLSRGVVSASIDLAAKGNFLASSSDSSSSSGNSQPTSSSSDGSTSTASSDASSMLSSSSSSVDPPSTSFTPTPTTSSDLSTSSSSSSSSDESGVFSSSGTSSYYTSSSSPSSTDVSSTSIILQSQPSTYIMTSSTHTSTSLIQTSSFPSHISTSSVTVSSYIPSSYIPSSTVTTNLSTSNTTSTAHTTLASSDSDPPQSSSPSPLSLTSLTATVFTTTDLTTSAQNRAPTPYTSTLYITSIYTIPGQKPSTTVQSVVLTSGVLSTSPPGTKGNTVVHPGTIVGIVLGTLGAFFFLALLAFCAHRRMRSQRNSVHGPDWDPSRSSWTPDDWRRHGRGVLEGEDDSEIGGRTSRAMEERFAGILAAMRVDADEVLSNDEPGVRDVSPARVPLPASPTLPASPSMYGHTHVQMPNSPLSASSDVPQDGLPFPVSEALLPPHAYTAEGAPYAYTTDEGHYLPNDTTYHGQQSLMRPPDVVLAPNYSTGRRTSPGPDAGAWLGGRDYSEFGVGGYQGSDNLLFRPLSNPQSQSFSHSQHSNSHSLARSGSHSLSHSRSQSTGFGGPTRSGSEEPLLFHGGMIGSSSGGGSGSRNVNAQAGMGSRSTASSSSHGHILVSGKEKRGNKGAVPPTSYTYRSKEDSKKSQFFAPETRDERPGGMRAFFGRLRGGRGSNSATASLAGSASDIESRTTEKRGSVSSFTTSVNNHSVKQFSSQGISPTMPPLPPLPSLPPPPPAPVFSFVLSNPDSRSSSAYTHVSDLSDGRGNSHPHDTEFHSPEVHDDAPLPMPAWPWMPSTMPLPSPPPEDSLRFRGLLDPNLVGRRGLGRGLGGGDGDRSVASLRDFEDYSRPIGGIVNNRMYSTTTFDTQDTQDTQDAPVESGVHEEHHKEHS